MYNFFSSWLRLSNFYHQILSLNRMKDPELTLNKTTLNTPIGA